MDAIYSNPYWAKLRVSILDDPEWSKLSDRLFRRRIGLLLLAKELDDDGRLPSTENIAWRFRVDISSLETDLTELQQKGITNFVSGNWYYVDYEESQKRTTSAERTKRYRAKAKTKNVDESESWEAEWD